MKAILVDENKFSADLIKIPCDAPLPVPTIIATGVASPNAHGHEITSTEIPILNANSKVCPFKAKILLQVVQ